jgi:hypothetical protein
VSAYLLASDGKILTFPCTVKNGYVGFYAPMVGTIAIVELLPTDGQTGDVKKSDVSQTAQGQTDANTNDNAAITPGQEQDKNPVSPERMASEEVNDARDSETEGFIQNYQAWLQTEFDNAQLSKDGKSMVKQDGSSAPTSELAKTATSIVPSQYINGPAKQNVFLTALNSKLENGAQSDKALEGALDRVVQLNNDLSKDMPNNITNAEKTAYVEAYVESTRQSIAENKPYRSARAQAKTAATKAVEDLGNVSGDVIGGYSEAGLVTDNTVAVVGGAVYESKSPDGNAESNTVNAAIAPVNANTAIAPVFGTVKGDHSGALGD